MAKLGAYIITVESRPERVEDATSLAQAIGQAGIFDEVSLHPAIYWRDEGAIVDYLTRYPEHTFAANYFNECLMGQVAVTLSHVSTWRRLVESGHDGAVVFEDDVYVTDMARFGEVLDQIGAEETLEWVRLNLFRTYRDAIVANARGSLLVDDPQPWGFATYYVSRSGAEKLLRHSCNFQKPVDWHPPLLSKAGILKTKAVSEVLVDHHPFDGDASELEHRHPRETGAAGLQKTPSTIYTSPPVSDNAELCRFLARLNAADALRRHGVTVLRGVFDHETIEAARRQVLDHRGLFRNTRPTPSAGHLAGFHRIPELESLHRLLTDCSAITQVISLTVGRESVRTIGLSDITINRSQQWHVDLLRGKYQIYLKGVPVWSPSRGAGGGVYKALLYLNDSDSLKVIKGSHHKPLSLAGDDHAVPAEDAEVTPISVFAGDVVLLDLRCCHRGAEEAAYASGQWDDDPRILVSTVFGDPERPLTRAMEIGNSARLKDWSAEAPSESASALFLP